MDQNPERRGASWRSRRGQNFLRTSAQAVAATALMVAGFVWAAQQPAAFGRPGALLQVPGALISTPAPPAHFTYLAQALGEDEARRLEPLTFRVAEVLKRYARDDAVADRAAAAVVLEGEKHKLDASLLVGLMIIENAKIDPVARSNVGATGLMQVMPFHSGKWGCESSNLDDIEANICHGVNILADLVKRSPNLDRALLRYNGCVRGTNTPNCHTYPKKVRGYASHAASMMTAMEQGRDIRSIALIPKLNLGTARAAAKKAPVKKAPARKRVASRG
jgi:soluble lytic murein transglycosylase-like protein